MRGDGRRGTILVIGGGISGITAAIEASEAGAEVVLVEQNPYLGGRVAQLSQYFPKMCPPTCGLEINFKRIRTSSHIRCLTQSVVEKVRGEPGNYTATIRRLPRYVNTKCTACGACVEACPVERADEFNCGMGTTKAVYLPFEMAQPLQFVIDGAVCPGVECGKCVPACPYDAIELAMQPEIVELQAQSVIWATGWDPFPAEQIESLGFGTYPDVITNLMMERLASGNGPTNGKIQRPSDGNGIDSVAFVQCAGSRDENYLKHCSGVCCLASLKQARLVRQQYPEAQIYIFYIDIRAPGRLEDFFVATEKDERLSLVKGKVAKITQNGARKLRVDAEDALSMERITRDVDLVVLATGMVPCAPDHQQVHGGLRTDEFGFLTGEQEHPSLLVAGCAKRPTDVATCLRDATGAAMKALASCGE